MSENPRQPHRPKVKPVKYVDGKVEIPDDVADEIRSSEPLKGRAALVSYAEAAAKADPEKLQKKFGSQDPLFAQSIVFQLMNLDVIGTGCDVNSAAFGLATIRSIEPKNATEAMLVVQMVAIHNAMLRMYENVIDAREPHWVDSCSKAMNNMARTYATMFEALVKARASAPNINVGSVNVHDGGQAIVGNVASRGENNG